MFTVSLLRSQPDTHFFKEWSGEGGSFVKGYGDSGGSTVSTEPGPFVGLSTARKGIKL